MAGATTTKISPYQRRLLHKNKELLGKMRLDADPFDDEHRQALSLVLQAYGHFTDLCDRYPLPAK